MAGQEIYIARAGAWLARALSGAGDFAATAETDELGFQLHEDIASDPGVLSAGKALGDAGARLEEAADELDTAAEASDDRELAKGLVHFAEGVFRLLESGDAIVTAIKARAAPLAAPEREAAIAFADQIPRRLIDYLTVTALDRELAKTSFILQVLGLIEIREVLASGGVGEPSYLRKELKLDRIKSLFRDPAAHFGTVYGWGTGAFDPGWIFNGFLRFHHPEASIAAGKVGADAFIQAGSWRLARDSSVVPPGLLLDYSAVIRKVFNNRAAIDETWGIDVEADLVAESGAIFRARPPFEISAAPKAGNLGGAFTFRTNRNPAARGFTIVGGNDLLRLTADDFAIGADLVVGASTTTGVAIDPGVFTDLKGLSLSLGSEGSDSFLASLLASADVRGEFDLGLSWRLSQGLKVTAAGGLEIAIPMHQNLGIATLDTLYLILKIRDDGSFALETSVAITGNLGPLKATVERMGVEAILAFSDTAEADLGPLSIKIGFKPPNGVGLAIDAGVVRGGGYLYLDYEKGEYAGALELIFSGFLAVKAIGLITTKMPDGSDGFSLLIIVTAEFGTPIQLGFGFTLIGLGGLLGLNRTMMLEELAEGVRTGAVESVMFPQDVVANAPRIISDLRRFFPPQQGRFLIGPMAKLGWGTPTLISGSLGVIVEVPPGNVAILGVLKCVLPDEDAALLVLQVKFIGAIEPTKQRLWFFASLFGSRVLFMPIGGEMGLLIAWGPNPNFVLSVGGFHPLFTPPPLPFPTPQRVSISILNQPFARIRVEGYFAVTSNTAQFGARADLFFGIDDFSVEGHLAFDALFQFSPFYFVITFSASMSVKVFGTGVFSVRIRGKLEGTSPWHVEGEGSISLLFFDIDIPISHTWGEAANTVLEPIDALQLLESELKKRESWIALPPSQSTLSVSLRAIEATEELVLHPAGVLRISQRAVPLNVEIQKVGNRAVDDVHNLTIDASASGLTEKGRPREAFAPAQYRNIEGAEKLSTPGYEKMDAGSDLSVSGSDTRTSHAVKRVVLQELIIIDSNYKEHIGRLIRVGVDWFRILLSSNATARSGLSQATKAQKLPFAEKVKAVEPGFVLANSADNKPWGAVQTFGSQSEARDALAAELRANPKAVNDLHIIPAAEARKAA